MRQPKRLVALALAWVMGLSQATPVFANSYMRPKDTGRSGVAQQDVRAEKAWIWGAAGADPLTDLGRANLFDRGKEIVGPAFDQGLAFPLVGPGARPVEELAELYAIGYRRRIGTPLPAADLKAFTERLTKLKTGLEQALRDETVQVAPNLPPTRVNILDLVRYVLILDELGGLKLGSTGITGTVEHHALIAYGGTHGYPGWETTEIPGLTLDQRRAVGSMSAYSNMALIEQLLESGKISTVKVIARHEADDLIRNGHVDEPAEVQEETNKTIGEVFAQEEQRKAEESALAVTVSREAAKKRTEEMAKRVQVVPYMFGLGQFFEGNRPPVFVLRALETRLDQAAREGRITDSRVKPLGDLTLVEVHYNGPERNANLDRLVVDLVTEVIATVKRQQQLPLANASVLTNGALGETQAVDKLWAALGKLEKDDPRSLREAIRKSRDPYYALDAQSSAALESAGLLESGGISDAARNVILSGAEGLDVYNPRQPIRLAPQTPLSSSNSTMAKMKPGDWPLDTLPYGARAKLLLQGPSGSFAFRHGGSEPVWVSVALGGGPAAFNWPIMKLLDEAVQNQLKIEGIRVDELKTLRGVDQKKDKETIQNILELEQELKELQQLNPKLKADMAEAQADAERLTALRNNKEELERELKRLGQQLAKEAETEGPGYVVVIERVADILAGKPERTAYRFAYPRSAPYIHTLVDDQTEWAITKVLPRPGSRRYDVSKSPTAQDSMLEVMVDRVSGVPVKGESFNPVLIGLQQSGFPAIGEFAAATSQFYITTAGAGEGVFHRGVIPVTAEEADRGDFAARGLVRLVSDTYMSFGTTRPQDKPGRIPHSQIEDQVGITSDIRATRERNLWVHDELAMMGSFQPAVSAPEVERRAKDVIAGLGARYHEIPTVIVKDADNAPRMLASGKPMVKLDPILEVSNMRARLTISDLKADIGATGHQSPYALQYAAFRASFKVAQRHGLIKNYDLGNAGDDNHFVLFHDKGVDDPDIHALAFTTFFRAGWLIHQLGYQLYGDMQDFVDPQVQQLIKERKLHLYAKLDDEFMAALKEELEWMPEAGRWAEIEQGYQRVQQGVASGAIVELRAPGNVTGMGIGFAEKAFSQAEIDLFGNAGIVGNDKAAAGAFNFGIYWALRLSVLLKNIYADKTQSLTTESIRARLAKEVAERMPDTPPVLRDTVVRRLLELAGEVLKQPQENEKYAHWIGHGVVVETWDVAPGSRAFIDVESEDAKLLTLLSAQNEHNVKRIWVKQRDGWIGDLSTQEVEAIGRLVDKELRENLDQYRERKQQLQTEVALYESTKSQARPKGRSRDVMNPWERMLLDLPIESTLTEIRPGEYVGKDDASWVKGLRPRLIEYYKVREFLGDDYLAAVSTEKLAAVTHGQYVGKDDSVLVGIEPFARLYRGITSRFVRVNIGNARGSHWVAMRPEKSPVAGGISKEAVAVQWSNPIEIAYRYRLVGDGSVEADPATGLARREDMYGSKEFDPIRDKVSKFNLIWIQTQGGSTPHGPNVERDIESSYPAKQTLESLIRSDSPFAFQVSHTDLRTIGQGAWSEQFPDAAGYVLSPQVAVQAANAANPRWVVLDASVYTQGPDAAIVHDLIQRQLDRALGGGQQALRFVVVVRDASTPEQAEKVLAAIDGVHKQFSGSSIAVYALAGKDVKPGELLGKLEALVPHSQVGSVIGPADWAKSIKEASPKPEDVAAVAFEPATQVGKVASGSAAVIAGVEAAAASGKINQALAAKLKLLQQDGVIVPEARDAEASTAQKVQEFQTAIAQATGEA